MSKKTVPTMVIFAITVTGLANWAHSQTTTPTPPNDIFERESLTNGIFGLNDALDDHGITVELLTTNVYQQNIHGGRSTHRRAGRYAGSYDFEFVFDLEKIVDLNGAKFVLTTEGSWSHGITDPAVGSIFPVNADAAGDRPIDIVEFWYDQSLYEDKLHFRIGKLDLKGKIDCQGCRTSFDGNNYANNKKRQFLNKALDHNRSIPFPDNAIGAIIQFNPIQWWYLSAGAADAQANEHETGFNTAFHDEDYFLYMLETGLLPTFETNNGPLPGAYRIGMWYDPQDKERFENGRTKRDDTGFYLSVNQLLLRENNTPDDKQGLGAFARYGWANSELNKITNFWSLGAQYQGLLPNRDKDVIGFGFVQGVLTDQPNAGFTEDAESVYELYYRIIITPWLEITPDIQYINNPGGDQTISDATLFGVRVQMTL